MKVIHCYAQGGKHIKLNKPCEDRTYSMCKNGVSVIVLADGAGSDKYMFAASGAECITRIVAEFFCENFDKFYDNNDEEKLKKVLISVCLKQLSVFAKENNIDDIRKMASTLLCVAVKNERAIICHLGDGVIGKLTKNGTQIVSFPENGEFANCTYFVTSNKAEEHLRIIKRTNDDVYGYFMMSDGVADYIFDDASHTFYDSARKMTLLATEEDGEKKLAETLDKFIISVDSNSDDCSFAAMIIEENLCYNNADILNGFVEGAKKRNIDLLIKTKKRNCDLKKVIVIASFAFVTLAIVLVVVGVKKIVDKDKETTSIVVTTNQESTTIERGSNTIAQEKNTDSKTNKEKSNAITEKTNEEIKNNKEEKRETIKNNTKEQKNQNVKKGDYNVR